jgi:osmotically-inducible protein OsmY
MKRVLLSVTCVSLLAASPLLAVPLPQASTVKPSDRTLHERVEKRLESDAALKKHDIEVAVDNGVVTLTGTVATEGERKRAGEMAAISGVSRVDNRIVADLSAGVKGTGGKVEETAKKAGEKTKQGAEKVVEKTKEGLSKTGEVITDTWITSRVSSRFVGEDLLKDSNINVDTNDHVVTLNGTVMSAAGRARAIQIAKDTEGVHRVVDHLTIGPKR